jgi:hypothetical protein
MRRRGGSMRTKQVIWVNNWHEEEEEDFLKTKKY